MKVTIDVFKVAAAGRVELDVENVQAAKDKALLMVKGHSVLMSKPKDEFIAVVAKAIGDAEVK